MQNDVFELEQLLLKAGVCLCKSLKVYCVWMHTYLCVCKNTVCCEKGEETERKREREKEGEMCCFVDIRVCHMSEAGIWLSEQRVVHCFLPLQLPSIHYI